jgi:peptide deformylase
MAVREVLRMGHPVLREKAKPVEAFGTPELRALFEDMKETMAAKNGAGLAAPQIGVSQRIVIFGVDHNPRYPDAEEVPFTVLVNPKLVMLTREVEEDWEGCLSCAAWCLAIPSFAIPASTSRAIPSSGWRKDSTRALSNTNATTWTASSIRSA